MNSSKALCALLLVLTSSLAPLRAQAQQPPPQAQPPPGNPFAALANRKPQEITNSIGMEFVEVPQGSFVMGRYAPRCPEEHPAKPSPFGPPADWAPSDYAKCNAYVKRDFRPGFLVSLPDPYFMGKYEVTQAQFEKVMGFNPSYFRSGPENSANRPVDSVTWEQAHAFVQKLNELEHTNVYRLPSEPEWEWAARAGQEPSGPWVVFNFGNDANGVLAGATGRSSTAEVGTKKTNPWGLYDMLGNVWEWVNDFYNDRYLADPVPPKRGTTHVLKGGSFLRDANLTFATDHAGGPGSTVDVGFRVMRASP